MHLKVLNRKPCFLNGLPSESSPFTLQFHYEGVLMVYLSHSHDILTQVYTSVLLSSFALIISLFLHLFHLTLAPLSDIN